MELMKKNELPRWQLNSITEEVGGTIEYLNCNDSKNEWKKVVIEYGHQPRTDLEDK
tara:strand:+ start:28 stop:195 length:168 start_codon:yes stop_codon:yes gene_type:complete